MTRSPAVARFLALIFYACFIPLALAQFNFFDMFGHGQQQQQRHGGSPTSQWAAHADNVQCNDYLCPETLVCVTNPADCPCPYVEDEKCLIPDPRDRDSATVVCVRGSEGCAEIERLASKWK